MCEREMVSGSISRIRSQKEKKKSTSSCSSATDVHRWSYLKAVISKIDAISVKKKRR